MSHPLISSCVCLALVSLAGCRSPYYADQGALVGGLGGAGVGALVGNAVGNTGAGAAIGAGVGAISGALVGSGLDDIEARNRAEIEARMGRPIPAGTVTMDDTIAMTRAGLDEELIANHIHAHGVTRPVTASDLIVLQQNGVGKRAIAAMQDASVAQAPPPVVYQASAPPPVIVEEHYYGDPYWGPRYYHHHHYRRPSYGWGFSVSNDFCD